MRAVGPGNLGAKFLDTILPVVAERDESDPPRSAVDPEEPDCGIKYGLDSLLYTPESCWLARRQGTRSEALDA